MADFILIDNDQVIFFPSFGPAMVVVKPGKIPGSGPSTFQGKRTCLEGDEKKVAVSGCMYTAGPFSIPGSGTLKIEALAGDQTAHHSDSGGKKLLLRGSQFTAKFEVQSPAREPGSSKTDPVPVHKNGRGIFVNTNSKFQGT